MAETWLDVEAGPEDWSHIDSAPPRRSHRAAAFEIETGVVIYDPEQATAWVQSTKTETPRE